jgi:hypothetical protein
MFTTVVGMLLLFGSTALVLVLKVGNVDRQDAAWLANPFMPLVVSVLGGVGASLCLRAWLRAGG